MNQHSSQQSFTSTLYHKADKYFNSQSSGKNANLLFGVKSILLLCIYIVSYFYFTSAPNLAGMLIAATLLGICHVFIPVNISHDAIHKAVSPNRWINTICLYGFEITGSNSYMYSAKHLEAHFNKENGSKTKGIETQRLLLKIKETGKSVNLPWFFYLFYSQYMIFFRDFELFSKTTVPLKEFIKLFFWKGLYIVVFIVLPFIFINAPWWEIAVSLLYMYLVVTMVLVIILLMPTEKMEHSKLNNSDNDKWAVEILEHNVDFSPGSRLLNLVAGGANLNVVHYLFPSVNHVHYNRLALMIEETSREYGLHYRKQLVTGVFRIHFNYIKNIQNSNG